MAVGEVLAGIVGNLFGAPSKLTRLNPLPPELESAITYTMREERRNGPSRRAAESRRMPRVAISN
jgi:hypothetical protein